MREHGVRGTTTRAVARRAGVAEGSIYNHFTNRSELIVSAFELATREIRAHAHALDQLVGAHTVTQNLTTLMEAVIEFFEEIFPIVGAILGDTQLRSWFTEGAVSGPEGQDITPMTGAAELSKYLEAEHQEGRIPAQESWQVCAGMLIGTCLHYVYLKMLSPHGMAGLTGGTDLSTRAYVRTAIQALLIPNEQ